MSNKTHLPCPDCNSSDALTLYTEDNHTHCFACNKTTFHTSNDQGSTTKQMLTTGLQNVSFPARQINKETCKVYQYYLGEFNGEKVHVANYSDNNRVVTGQKIRFQDKRFKVLGEINNRFFGQHLYPNGGKRLVITEGEIDCLTVAQVNGLYPVVSLPFGANSAKKTFKHNLEWLSKWEEVIVMFDNDEQGIKASKDVLGILPIGKLKYATLPYKDANECLLKGEEQAIIKAVYNAEECKPDGIVNGNTLLDKILNEDNEPISYSYSFGDDLPLESMTRGIRKGELVVVTAGTGIGKSTFIRQMAHNLGVKDNLKIGMMMLEENTLRTAKGILSIELGTRLHITRKGITNEQLTTAFDNTLGKGNFVLYEHFGSLDGGNLLDKIRYLAVGEDVDFIFLDHISIAISGIEGTQDERKLLDYLMTKLRSIVEETGVGMVVVSHLRRADTSAKSHEEGGMTSLAQLRGSHAISQLADTVIGLERNQQAEDSEQKNSLKVRVLKCRHTGDTGLAGTLIYQKAFDKLVQGGINNNYDVNDKKHREFGF